MVRLLLLVAIALAANLGGIESATAHDATKYPDLKGQWDRFIVPGLSGQPSFDQTKGSGFAQQAPLTPEYRKILEESIADQVAGGHGNSSTTPAVLQPVCPG